MKKNKKEKLNDGCVKIFKMLNLLYEDKAYYDDVVNIFKDELSDQSTNNLQVVLNKYINTLKVFGIKIKKDNNKFRLESSIYSLEYSLDDLKSLNILLNFAKNFPDKDVGSEVENFVQNFMLRMNSKDRITLDNFTKNHDFSFYHSDLKEQIEECKRLCKEKHSISIIYRKNSKEIKSKFTPIDVWYDSKTAYLQVYDAAKEEKIDIALPNILVMNALPQKANYHNLPTTVVYKVKNRLAKTYKIKENEYSRGFDSEGNQIIVNQGEPIDELLSRLMRYSYNCEIQTPKTLRKEMIARINETLKNYK